MREVYKAIGRVAGQDVTVLITGETGTGKELIARAIYQHGARSKAPFMALNCAAIPENLLESELFGHEKGSFTGADRRRIGKFEQCNGGTIMLDEIGDMPPALQAKILRLIQEQAFERVGGNESVRTDVRLIAATHRDLKTLSAEGKFRADLYYRLSVFTIRLPPLRDRGDDLLMLVQHCMRRCNREMGREIQEIDSAALERLRNYSWPGNIRELQSVIKQAMLQARGSVLLPAFLPDLAGGHPESPPPASVDLAESLTSARTCSARSPNLLDRLLGVRACGQASLRVLAQNHRVPPLLRPAPWSRTRPGGARCLLRPAPLAAPGKGVNPSSMRLTHAIVLARSQTGNNRRNLSDFLRRRW
jgi:two-component system nitrogen regulation response regulator GlnG